MRPIRIAIGALRADVGFWYLIDLRRTSPASWIPVVLMAAFLGGLAMLFRLQDHNDVGALVCLALLVIMLAAKLMATRSHSQHAR